MRLLFGTKDPAVREREAWIILLSRETKKENDIVVERLARSICCNFFFYGPTLQQLQLRFHSFNTSFKQLFGSFPTFLPETHHREMLKCLHSQESLLTKQYHSNLLKWAQSLYGFLITKQGYKAMQYFPWNTWRRENILFLWIYIDLVHKDLICDLKQKKI